MLSAQQAVEEFWSNSGLDKTQDLWPQGVYTCRDCCRTYKREQDLKGHHTRGKCEWKSASRYGSRAWRAARRQRKKKTQTDQIRIGQDTLESVFDFKYLGVWVCADGDLAYAMEQFKNSCRVDLINILILIADSGGYGERVDG